MSKAFALGAVLQVCVFLEGVIFVFIGRVLLRMLWGCSSSASLLPSPWDEPGPCFAPGCAMLLVCSSPGQMYSCLSRFGSPGDDFVSKSLFCLFFNFGNSAQSLPAVSLLLAELLVLNASGQAGLLKRFWFPC